MGLDSNKFFQASGGLFFTIKFTRLFDVAQVNKMFLKMASSPVVNYVRQFLSISKLSCPLTVTFVPVATGGIKHGSFGGFNPW